MKKIALALALTLISSAFANDICQRSCQSAFDQGGLACYKSMQMCMRYSGIAGTERYDFCQGDYDSCLEKRYNDKEACLESCGFDQD